MKKNFIRTLLIVCLAVFSVAMLSSCFGGDSDTEEPKESEVVELTYKNTELASSGFSYDGKAKTPAVIIEKDGKTHAELTESNDEFTVVYSDNVNAGTGSVTVTATEDNENFTGSVTLSFTISALSATLTSNNIVTLLADPNIENFVISSDITIPEGQTVEIRTGVKITVRYESASINIINNGTIINNGSFVIGEDNSLNRCYFYNNGTITNNNDIFVKGTGYLYNNGTLTNNDILYVAAHGTLASNTDISNITKDTMFTHVTRRRSIQSTSNYIALEYTETDYDGTEKKPTVTFTYNETPVNIGNYTVSYAANKNVGTATVKITAVPTSSELFGETTLTFEIKGVATTVTRTNRLIEALADENYAEITANNVNIAPLFYNGADVYEIVVPEGKTLTFTGSCGLRGTDMTLKNSGGIVFEGSFFVSGILENNGIVTNKGNLFVEGSSLTGNAIINTDGEAFVNAATDKITENVTIRTRLATTDVTLQSVELSYNGDRQLPSFNFVEDVAVGTYDTKCLDSTGAATFFYTNVGDYSLKIIAGENSKYFFGSITIPFSIVKGETTANDYNTLKTALADGNYKKVTLSQNLILSTLSPVLTIPEGSELCIAQNVEFNIKTPLAVNGKITNNGTFIFGYYMNVNLVCTSAVTGSGSFENNGTLYANDSAPTNYSGDGTLFVRKSAKDVDLQLVDPETRFIYAEPNGVVRIFKPEIEVKDDGTVIPSADNYSVGYAKNYEAGTALITLVSKITAEKLYGDNTVCFTIEPGETTVSTPSELTAALTSYNSQGKTNWKTVTLSADIKAERSLTVPYGMTVDCKQYVITKSAPVQITNNGVIEINKQLGDTVISSKSTGKLITHVSTADQFNNMVNNGPYPPDIIYIDEDIAGELNVDCDRRAITIDLQGHTLGSKVTINIDGSTAYPVTIKSTGAQGSLGDGSKSPSLVIDDDIVGNTTISLSNLIVYGDIDKNPQYFGLSLSGDVVIR